MTKFNVVVEYDFYEEYNQESFEELVAIKIADQITKDISFQSAGAYRKHIEKVSNEVKNEVIKQIVNLISDEVLSKFEAKIETKLNTELNKKFEDKLHERVSKKVKSDLLNEVKEAARTEIKKTFRGI
jgi:hypothetical protein